MRLLLQIIVSALLFSSIFAQNKSITSFLSQEQTVNGFSNVFLGVDQAEPYIATNPRDPLNSICSFTFGSYYTLDGVNWNKITALNSQDPFLTFDSLGNAYYTPGTPWIYSSFGVQKSTNKGVNWSGNYLIYNAINDKPCICANQSGGAYSNYLYTAWQYYTQGIFFSRSVNQGANWSPAVLLNNEINYCPYLAIGPSSTTTGGMIYYGYNSYDSVNIFTKIKKSSDAGITFSPEIHVATFIEPGNLKINVSPNACIQMAADNSYGPYRGNVYIVYTGKGTGTDKADIFFTKSTNYGDNWSAPIKLNDDNTLNDQWMPAISVDKYGKVYIIWYDSRIDPQNYMTLLYGTVSTNGGATFIPDLAVSTTPFNPDNMTNYTGYMGHYISVSAIGNTAIASWTDGRGYNFGSYVGYFPDFAMTLSHNQVNLSSNDSLTATVKIPAVKGPYSGTTKFTYSFDTLPTQGNISVNFLNKDSITNFPDSIYLKIKLTNVTVPRRHRLIIKGSNTANSVPVHTRYIDLMVNSSMLNIGTNRAGTAQYKVNGTQYNFPQSLFFLNGSNVTVQAVSPFNATASIRYVFVNWSDAGDTTHSFSINSNTYLTANYKTQFKVALVSSVGNSFGGNVFYDSSSNCTFGVYSKRFVYNGQTYRFAGWTGSGAGSYTSSDSTGNDSTVVWSVMKSYAETARWIPVTGISQISSEIPEEYKLFNAYPNPFNPSTIIKFDLPVNSQVTLKVYDILGKEVAVLINEKLNPGYYTFRWNAKGLPSGIYFYRIESENFKDAKRMLLLK